MTSPFGGHPTLAQYVAWARSEGCTTKSGYTEAVGSGPQSILLIEAPDTGRYLPIVGMSESEYLAPTEVARFDRRLGLQSPYFALDPEHPTY